MNNRRKLIVALGASALSAPFGSFAQPAGGKVYKIGYLGASAQKGSTSLINAMRSALRDLGYEEGRNFVLVSRWADGRNDRLQAMAAELVDEKADVIVTSGTPATMALKRATTTVPIVMATSGDAVFSGLVASLAHPGGNVTGSSFFSPELAAKRLELLKELVPTLKKVGYLVNMQNAVAQRNLEVIKRTAQQLRIMVQVFPAGGRDELEPSIVAASKARMGGLLIGQDASYVGSWELIAELAVQYRLPTAGARVYGENGGLIGYGQDELKLFQRAAVYVDKILKGAKPANLPVEQPTRFELVINMKTAKALSVKVPNSVLVRTDQVIE